MTFVADTINFREIVMKEPLPLATIQIAVIDFLRGRDDVVLFGAQAVNVYVSEPRATRESIGSHSITAVYGGDGRFDTSSSTSLAQVAITLPKPKSQESCPSNN